ncbi:alpha/beta hydrolase [Novosphingobium sp. JCM 18896]|uniref:alpha/beta hydrolase n=1 Tax=Novosphingobium sp. JCM 18896 TaxID=2989731 RepID=UPI00222217F8|nr:alpha/beta hydrolase [Novosphingobium sp. JCM 18896]MCW1428164.1 alpha/beta hydrolase [Novosphingobium sp. JCM 18896]
MSEPFVRPDVRKFLDGMAANPRPVFNDAMMVMIRQMPSDAMAGLDLPVGELGEIRDVTMAGPGGDIALRLYDPRADRAPGPVVVFYHGGGFVVGSIDTHAGLAAEMARQLDLPVISVEYRLAPEHKWPSAPDDGEAAARWIAENGAAFGREFTHLVLAGDSAGGNLTLVVANDLHARPAALPLLALLAIYPKADSSKRYGSMVDFADGYGLESANMAYYDQAYAPDGQHVRHSPILADLVGLPPTLVVTAALDPLRDEGRAYAAAAALAGVDVTYREYRGTIHGFSSYRRLIPSAQADMLSYLALARAMIAEALAG